MKAYYNNKLFNPFDWEEKKVDPNEKDWEELKTTSWENLKENITWEELSKNA